MRVGNWPLTLRLAPPIGGGLLRALHRTLRRRDLGRERVDGILGKGERVICVFWHGRLLLMPFAYPPHVATTLISHHRDGEIIARVAERLGFPVVRGSATRGGAKAFRQLRQILAEGRHVGITPDGPRGPCRRAKPGAIELSRLSGMPILPVAFGASPALTLRSWDRFLVPLPFARVVFVWGEPLYVPPEVSRAEAEAFQEALTARLDGVTAEADRRATGADPAGT
jgi:hypothetical protein